jgi:hypothetical protein
MVAAPTFATRLGRYAFHVTVSPISVVRKPLKMRANPNAFCQEVSVGG